MPESATGGNFNGLNLKSIQDSWISNLIENTHPTYTTILKEGGTSDEGWPEERKNDEKVTDDIKALTTFSRSEDKNVILNPTLWSTDHNSVELNSNVYTDNLKLDLKIGNYLIHT